MYSSRWTLTGLATLALSYGVHAQHFRRNFTTPTSSLVPNPFSIRDDRPPECPPCFNCNLEAFTCYQAFECDSSTGFCDCPPGYGGTNCADVLCGSLAGGKQRPGRETDPDTGKETCKCDDGWGGINCNVCQTDDACIPLMPDEGKDGAVCYKGGALVKENHQMCDITNQKILDQLGPEKKPQATFSCNAEMEVCNFQFWVDQKESFFCALEECSSTAIFETNSNSTAYNCNKVECACIPGRFLCGEENSIDIGDFLKSDIKGPASFKSKKTEGGSKEDGSFFSEPAMDNLISTVFGDTSIFLSCNAGECLYKTQVPGQETTPEKTINTPLIAGVISGTALFIVAVVLLLWFSSRRAHQKKGFIRLSEVEEDENAKLLADHEPAALYFEDVTYSVKGKQILSGITGTVNPGQILAIMGGSGAGKTTFLDILARKNKMGTAGGNIYLNGEKVSDEDFKNVIGFVDQEDTLLPTLTVHETIMDSAMLRLPKEMSRASKEQKVEDVEKQLGIHHIRDSLIGSEEGERGISGGEKRRVGIACELVTSPSILFLDEPTSGLDAYNAYNVIESLVQLVKNYNRTVVFTIHQPRSNIVALFDQLVLLAKGRTVYAGPFNSCQSYFDSIGYACPPGFNIADYLVDLTMHAGTVHSPIDENSSLFERDGVFTSSSSAIAVKSVPSISGGSVGQDNAGDVSSPLIRPKSKRVPSVRQQQERELYTRRSLDTTKDDDEAPSSTPNQQWLRLQRQQSGPPPQILEDPDNVPEPAPNSTGTSLDTLISMYATSEVYKSTRESIRSLVNSANDANGANGAANGHGVKPAPKSKGYNRIGWLRQFVILSVRTWRNIYRNPMLMLTHYAIAIILGVLTGFLFFRLTDDIPGFQNRLGLNFFLLALFGFSTLTSLTVFAPERLLFVRERAKGYYSPVPYFAAKVVFDIVPLRLIPPIILGIIVYPMTGLVPAVPEFLKFMMFLILFNLAAAGVCLFIGVLVKNPGVANLIGSLVMLFSLLFGGFLLNHDTIPAAVLWLQYLSIFHFAFEGLMVNEARYLQLIDKKYGLDISVPGSAILSSFGFKVLDLPKDAIGLAVFAASFILLAYFAMHFMLVERR